MIKQLKELPSYVKAVMGVVLAGVLVVAYLAWQLQSIRDNEDRRQCIADVGFRNDNRAMWIWIGNRFSDEDFIDELNQQLNELLPALTCNGNSAIPVEE